MSLQYSQLFHCNLDLRLQSLQYDYVGIMFCALYILKSIITTQRRYRNGSERFRGCWTAVLDFYLEATVCPYSERKLALVPVHNTYNSQRNAIDSGVVLPPCNSPSAPAKQGVVSFISLYSESETRNEWVLVYFSTRVTFLRVSS